MKKSKRRKPKILDGVGFTGHKKHFSRSHRHGKVFDVVRARYAAGHTLWLRFEDGTQGEVDLSRELVGPIFELLRDLEYFQKLSLNPEIGTIVWPNGADFSPEFLYQKARVVA